MKLLGNFDYKKLLIAGIILLIIWLSFLWLIVSYGKELRNHPCNVCAKKIGQNVVCHSEDSTLIFTQSGNILNSWGKEYPLID